MEIKQTFVNSLPKTLAAFKVGDSENFSYEDFKISHAQSYRSRISRDKRLGLLPANMKFNVLDIELDGKKKAVHITRTR